MTNQQLVNCFVDGSMEAAVTNHVGYRGNCLISYSTVICEIDRVNKTARVNVRKYSATTSRLQSRLLAALQSAGYAIEEYEGSAAYMWNAGYMGAPKLSLSDV